LLASPDDNRVVSLTEHRTEPRCRIHGEPAGAIQTFGLSLLLYVPLVFVLEEVFFRGALDTYVRGADIANDRTSAVFVSVLWGLWHLPLVITTIGLSQVLMILTYHLIVGILMTFPWRLSGNLAVPGVTHALIDAIRDGLAVR
jgi:membrane protease YdiL (CAAX protease family)